MYHLYGALLTLAWAAVLPWQMIAALVKGTPPPPLRERLGFVPAGAPAGGFWIHAVSVGEVRLALSLLPALRERFPGEPVHLTTGTATGRALALSGGRGTVEPGAASRGAPAVPESVSALPFDLPFAMGRLLDRLRPRAVLIVETEIWPNLLRLCARQRVPVFVVNGRISARTYPRYRAVGSLLRPALRGVRRFGMQSTEDADRIVRLGAPTDRVRVTGNLKFDLPPARADRADIRRRLGIPDPAPLFVAGSTAAGEEAPVLRAFAALCERDRASRLVLAPRHPENFPSAEAAARAAGRRVALWSRLGPAPAPGDPWDVLVLDAVGVLPDIYAAADLVFVGGSLVPRGGHNVLEPAALGKPVLFGPHMDNFRVAAESLTAAGAGFVARDADELGHLLVRLLTDRAGYRVASVMAARVVEANRGALGRTLAMLEEVLEPGRTLDRQAARP